MLTINSTHTPAINELIENGIWLDNHHTFKVPPRTALALELFELISNRSVRQLGPAS